MSLQAPTSTAAAAAAAKETPQERLKRLMQAQLNKAAQKDSLAVAQRKIQVCTGTELAAAPAAAAASAGHASLEMRGGSWGHGVVCLGGVVWSMRHYTVQVAVAVKVKECQTSPPC